MSVEVKSKKTLTSHDCSFLFLGGAKEYGGGKENVCGRMAFIDGRRESQCKSASTLMESH
jgi:hypothetical protein